jgi:hypothetical protein
MTAESVDLVQYWHAPQPPDYMTALIDSFRRHRKGSHTLFDQRSADRFIATHFSPREQQAFRDCAVPAMQADYFRYCAILVLGGAYVDADVLCYADVSPLLDEPFADGLLFRRDNGNIMNGFFVFRGPASPFLRLVLDVATANIERRLAEDVWLTTGPGLFTYLDVLNWSGSFDAFLEEQRSHEYEAIPAFAQLLCETIGDFARVQDAFSGIQVSEESKLKPYFIQAPEPLAYKDTTDHWTRVTGSIFGTPHP